MEQTSTLGISLGVRSLGIAVLRNGCLVDWQMKSFSDAMSQQKLHVITGTVLKIVKGYGVASVVLKLPLALDTHPTLIALKRHLLKALAARSIIVHCYTLADIKASLGVAVCNKQELAAAIVTLYPELRFVYHREKGLKNRYYIKLFEAVAVLSIHRT